MSKHFLQIKELLGNGLGHETVASAVGVAPSYITALMSDDAFAQEVAQLKIKNLSAHTTRDRNLDSIEDKLIAKIDDAVSMNMLYKPHDLLAAFRVINAAKRRGASSDNLTPQTVHTTINLTVPSRPAQQFTITPKGEVVQAGEQTLVSMTSHELLKNLQTGKSSERGSNYASVEKFLAPASERDS